MLSVSRVLPEKHHGDCELVTIVFSTRTLSPVLMGITADSEAEPAD